MDINYINKKFLSYPNIVSWCNGYAKENGCKTNIRLIDHKTHKTVNVNYVASLLYKMGIPAYRNTYNLRSFKNNTITFYLTVKGVSIALICDFIYTEQNEIKTVNGYVMDTDGQLSFCL